MGTTTEHGITNKQTQPWTITLQQQLQTTTSYQTNTKEETTLKQDTTSSS